MTKKLVAILAIAGLMNTVILPFVNNSFTVQAATFDERCVDTGVVLCSGLNATGEFSTYVSGDDLGTIRGVLDTTNKSSGAGSLKFTIPTLSGENSSGAYDRVFDEVGNGFAEGETFYVQFRQRFSPEMLDDAMGGNGWKQVILTSQFGYYGDAIDVALYNQGYNNKPVLLQNGTVFAQDPDDGTDVEYIANEWMTFAIRISVGTWSGSNSTIQVWAAQEGDNLEKIYDMTNVAIPENPSDVGSGFNKINLSPHNTGKLDSTSHAEAITWYDELIVSTEAIADPVDAPDTTAPTAPTLVAVTNDTAADLTWNGSTDATGVTGYKVYKDSVEIVDQAGTAYSDTGLSAGSYSYTVKAYDAATNLSAASNADEVTIAAPTPPPLPPPPSSGGGGGGSRPKPTPPPPAVTVPRHARSTLVINNGTIYFLGADLRYPFPSAAVFLSWGSKFDDVVPANTGDMAMASGPVVEFKTQTAQRHPRATLVNHNGTIYFLGAQIRYPFPSAEVFLSWGARFQDVVPANSGDIAMPVGPIVTKK